MAAPGPLLAALGPLLAALGPLWAALGPLLGALGPLLGGSWPLLGGSWPLLGRSWNDLQKSIKMPPRAVTKRAKIAPRRSQDGLMSVLFSHRFLHRFYWFWVRFWCHLGGLLGGPNPSFLASIFHRFLRVVPRAAQEWPRAAPAVGLVVEQKMSQVGGIGR